MTLEEIALQIATAQVGTTGVHTTDVTVIEWRRHVPGRYGVRDVYADTDAVVEHTGVAWTLRTLTYPATDIFVGYPTAQDAVVQALEIIQQPYELGVLTPNFAPEESR